MQINIFYNSPSVKRHIDERLIKKAVLAALGKFAKTKGETSVVFVSAKEIKEINKAFLNRRALTDVIAFNYPVSAKLKDNGQPFGDIFVCVESAKRQAKNLKTDLKRELLFLCIHGALHLAGMDDNNARKKLLMNKKTEQIIKLL